MRSGTNQRGDRTEERKTSGFTTLFDKLAESYCTHVCAVTLPVWVGAGCAFCSAGRTYRLSEFFQIVQEILDGLPLRDKEKETETMTFPGLDSSVVRFHMTITHFLSSVEVSCNVPFSRQYMHIGYDTGFLKTLQRNN